MKIAIIGTGEVGGTLGRLLTHKGHRITYGSRDPSSKRVHALVRKTGPNAVALLPKQAVADTELVVLATPWSATKSSLRSCGSLKGKMLLDCTNPFNDKTGKMELEGPTGAEHVSKWANTKKIVKGFNTMGANLFGTPKFGGQRLTMYYCGDAQTKNVVRRLIEQLGFESADCGGIEGARLLEALCGLWLSQAPKHKWKIAFRMVHS